MTNHKLSDASGLRKYYATVPHLIDDANISVYAYRLYGHIKRVAGDSGACYQNTTTLAKACNMSAGSVSKAKQELSDAGFITIEKMTSKNGEYDHITIQDVWVKNMNTYTASSPDEQGSSPHERRRSPGETKNNTIKNIQYEEVKPAPRKRDARLDHPAIIEYRKIAHLHVPITWRDAVIETVGDEPNNVMVWGELVLNWIGHGWNKANIKDMLDAHKNGGIEPKFSKHSTAARNEALLEEVMGDA
jgi:hypothetical protein